MQPADNHSYECYWESVRSGPHGRTLKLAQAGHPAAARGGVRRGGRGCRTRTGRVLAAAGVALAMVLLALLGAYILCGILWPQNGAGMWHGDEAGGAVTGGDPAASSFAVGGGTPPAEVLPEVGPSLPEAEVPADAPAPGGGMAAGVPASGPVQLEVEPVLQNPGLMNGCEATTLATLLGFWGFEADKSDLAYNWLPREDFYTVDGIRHGPDPTVAYAGDPATRQGFYCFAPAVCEGADSYLAAMGSALRGVDISGVAPEEFDSWLRQGCPVMVWVTLDYGSEAQYLDYGWTLPGGRWYTPYKNLHCVLLAGTDGEHYTVCDPLTGSVTVGREALHASYVALGSHAAVITA